MKNKFRIYSTCSLAIVLAGTIIFGACNKDLPLPPPPPPVDTTGESMADIFTGDTSYSFLVKAATIAGVMPALGDKNAVFTVFAPDNAAFRRSGIPSDAVLDLLPAAQVTAIVNYHMVGGQVYPSENIPETFPNLQLPTGLVLQAPFFRMSVFPSKRGANLWANNIPFSGADIQAANGVIHPIAALLSPPTTTLKGLEFADTTLTFFQAAVARADSGQVGLGRFDSLFNYAPVNFTVNAPDNNAFRALLPLLGLPPSTAAFNFIPVQQVRGIVAYHIWGTRAFAANLPTTATDIPTLLQVAPGTPPLTVKVQNTGVAITLKGNGNPVNANVIAADRHAVNGVLNKINMVLLPQ
jgi:uncharacterized surface protein with fasciclin (FAS1) repeats